MTGNIIRQNELVTKNDGIDPDEALAMATYQLVQSPRKGKFNYREPNLMKSPFIRPYPDFWFVEFESNNFDDRFGRYLVVINKKSGDIVFADRYFPYEVMDYDWVFLKK